MGKTGTVKSSKTGTVRGKVPNFNVEPVKHFDDFDISALCDSPGDASLVDELWSHVYPDVLENLTEEERTYLELVGKVRLLRFLVGYKKDIFAAAEVFFFFLFVFFFFLSFRSFLLKQTNNNKQTGL